MKDLRSRFSRRHWLSYSFIAAGLALLIYVSAQYGTMYREQQRLAQQWEQQNDTASTQADATPVTDGLTRLSIPKIKLDVVVVDGTTPHQLLIGPGRLLNTALPGDPGNTVISGHRDTFFRHIYELNKGDVIELKRNGSTYRYEVTGKKVVDPSDVSVIQPTRDPELTLITCYPIYYIGPAPERLVVMSKLLDSNSVTMKRAAAGGTP